MTASPEPDQAADSRPLTGVDPRLRRPVLSWLMWWLVAGGLALIFLPVNATLGAQLFGIDPMVAVITGIAQSAALPLVLVRPREATALQLLAVVVVGVAIPAGSASTWPLTVPGLLTLIAHIGLISVRYGWRAAAATWGVSVLLIPVVALLAPGGRSVGDGLLMEVLYPSLSAGVLGGVILIRRWQQVRRELADARRDIEVEQSHRAVAEERTRIARELHDVVAHSMSVVHMQATSASYRIENLDPDAEVEFKRIATGARAAMREMRQLLSVLRAEDADAELAPVPGLSGLGELLASAQQAGLPVEMRRGEAVEAAAVPERVALTAYRLIQESLSNVIRHAPGARTLIDIDLEGSDLMLSVVNEAAAGPAEPMEAAGSTGHGLTGMRERVRQVGGTLETAARNEGGYRVTARLPIGEEQ
ncbi:sensor histidine kinase [Paractinoplanes maris]|uniref:sensor histidine kinase n=1 Tax=Paractinoplanes maris TaxID=1734446 RepID=UPI002020484D|nr:histidine kinase [Actinoplanes maris]